MDYETNFLDGAGGKINSKNVKKYLPFIVGGLGLGLIAFISKKHSNENDRSYQTNGFSDEEQDIGGNVAGLFNQQQTDYNQKLNEVEQNNNDRIMSLSQQVGNLMADNQKDIINSFNDVGKSITEMQGEYQKGMMEMQQNFLKSQLEMESKIESIKQNQTIQNQETTTRKKYDDVYVYDGGNSVRVGKKVSHHHEVEEKKNSNTYKDYTKDFLKAKADRNESKANEIREKANSYLES